MKPKVYDRVTSFLGGTNAFNYPADLPENQSQLLQNMIVLASGKATTRPGVQQIDSSSPSFGNLPVNGPVQGMGFLDISAGQYILLAKGGKYYQWDGGTWTQPDPSVTPTNAESIVITVQGQDQLLISDGSINPMYLWGGGNNFTATATGSNDHSATDAPRGVTALAYLAGMFVAAGPAMQMGNGSTVQTMPADTLFFSNYLSAGQGDWNFTQSFRVGNGDGEGIIALAVVQSTASDFPVFQLAVLKSNSVWVVTIQPGSYYSATNTTPTEVFNAMFAALAASPQGDQVGTGVGCVGPKAVCVYQNDVLFMSQYGVQSLQRMQAAAGQYQLTAPLSQPIQPYIDRINWSVSNTIKAVKYKNYAIFFVPLDNSVTNNYALVWDGFLGQWMIFTGWNVEDAIVTRYNGTGGVTSVIQMVIGQMDGSVSQWLDGQQYYGLDSTYEDNGTPIAWQIVTRSFTFKNYDVEKQLQGALLRFNAGNASISINVFEDSSQTASATETVSPSGATLPFILPVVLGSNIPVPKYVSLLGLPYCNESWLVLSGPSGWIDIRSITAVACMERLTDPNA